MSSTRESCRLRPFLCVVLVVGCCAASSNAQPLNIDLGDDPTTEDGDYEGTAASGQDGVWNHLNFDENANPSGVPANEEFPLMNADGTDTGVTFVTLFEIGAFDPTEPTMMLLDSDLLGDFWWGTPGVPTTFEIRHLAPGEYNLFLYAYAGDVIRDDTTIIYNGESQTVAHQTFTDPFSHAFLDTFALFFPVIPDENGTVSFSVEAGPGVPGIANFWQINGLQLGLGDPSQLPPSLLFDQPRRGRNELRCCEYRWIFRNTNPVFAITEWHMEIEAGAGGRLPACTGSDIITVEGGWTWEYCYPWDLGMGVSAPSSRAVIRFTGPPLEPGEELDGTLMVDGNGELSFEDDPPPEVVLPYDPPGNHVVLPGGIHIHIRQDFADAPCDTGDFNSHNGQSNGWAPAIDVICLPPFLPVPSLSGIGRLALCLAMVLGGFVWLRRSAKPSKA